MRSRASRSPRRMRTIADVPVERARRLPAPPEDREAPAARPARRRRTGGAPRPAGPRRPRARASASSQRGERLARLVAAGLGVLGRDPGRVGLGGQSLERRAAGPAARRCRVSRIRWASRTAALSALISVSQVRAAASVSSAGPGRRRWPPGTPRGGVPSPRRRGAGRPSLGAGPRARGGRRRRAGPRAARRCAPAGLVRGPRRPAAHRSSHAAGAGSRAQAPDVRGTAASGDRTAGAGRAGWQACRRHRREAGRSRPGSAPRGQRRPAIGARLPAGGVAAARRMVATPDRPCRAVSQRSTRVSTAGRDCGHHGPPHPGQCRRARRWHDGRRHGRSQPRRPQSMERRVRITGPHPVRPDQGRARCPARLGVMLGRRPPRPVTRGSIPGCAVSCGTASVCAPAGGDRVRGDREADLAARGGAGARAPARGPRRRRRRAQGRGPGTRSRRGSRLSCADPARGAPGPGQRSCARWPRQPRARRPRGLRAHRRGRARAAVLRPGSPSRVGANRRVARHPGGPTGPPSLCTPASRLGNLPASAASPAVVPVAQPELQQKRPVRFVTLDQTQEFLVQPVDASWLQCNIECQEACPVGTNCRGYLNLAAEGRFEEGYILAREPNPVAAMCSYVCSAPCERACRRGDIDRPLAIRAMKRFLVEWHEASGIPDVMPPITPRDGARRGDRRRPGRASRSPASWRRAATRSRSSTASRSAAARCSSASRRSASRARRSRWTSGSSSAWASRFVLRHHRSASTSRSRTSSATTTRSRSPRAR